MTATVGTVDDMTLNASAWLNKTVVVEGKLAGPVIPFPEKVPPYDYELFRYNETSYASTVFIGVLWNSSNLYDLTNVLVIGVIRFVVGGDEFHTGGYFIEAESVPL